MRLFNDTDFPVQHVHSKLLPEEPFITVVVKGTFQLNLDGICTPLPKAKQAKIGKAVDFDDRVGNSIRSDHDAVPFKPRADCLFIGSAHAPHGKPVTRLAAAFSIGAMRKELAIYGDRAWLREATGDIRLVGPEPFTEMPIRAERAHGGPRSRFNRHGIGLAPLPDMAGATVPVANILHVGETAIPFDTDHPAAGFGVQPKTLLPRRALAGTYDAEWRYRRRPLPPADFDPGFFNAAPRDQQVEGYLVGDEHLHFENLNPDSPVVGARLPGIKVRCFVDRALDPERPDDLEFAEIVTCLDTCLVDMPNGTVTLIWRGTMEIADFEHERIKHLLVCQEPLSNPRDIPHYASLMAEHIQARQSKVPTRMSPEERQAKIDTLNAGGKERILALLKKGKVDPGVVAKIEASKDMEEAMAVLTEWVDEIKKTLPDLPSIEEE